MVPIRVPMDNESVGKCNGRSGQREWTRFPTWNHRFKFPCLHNEVKGMETSGEK